MESNKSKAYYVSINETYVMRCYEEFNKLYSFSLDIKNPELFLNSPQIQEEILMKILYILPVYSIYNVHGIQNYKSVKTSLHSSSRNRRLLTNIFFGVKITIFTMEDYIKTFFLDINRVSIEKSKTSKLVNLQIKVFVNSSFDTN